MSATDTNTNTETVSVPAAPKYGDKPHEAAHNAYLAAHNVAFDAIFEVATGRKPSAYLYDVLRNLDKAANAFADANREHGFEIGREIWGAK